MIHLDNRWGIEMDNEVAVIMPTYNRPDCIKLFCDTSIKTLTGTRFHLYVYDSSTDDKTYNLFNEHKNKNVTYYRLQSDITSDEKGIKAIHEVKEKYIYMLGDGNLVDFQALDVLLFSNPCNHLLINIEPKDRIGYLSQDKDFSPDKLYFYEDFETYVKKYFSNLTYWGGSIVRRDALLLMCDKHLEKYKIGKTSWWLTCLFVECLAAFGGKASVIYTDALKYNPAKKTRGWDKGENYYLVVFRIFNQNLASLPSLISEETKKQITVFFREDCLANKSYLIKKRLDKSIKYSLTVKYKKDIAIVPGYYNRILAISICPRFVLYIYRVFRGALGKAYRKLFPRRRR